MKENKISLKTRFDLFTKIISDFRSYKSRTDEIELMNSKKYENSFKTSISFRFFF